ncbi:MAG: hypothetical protein MJ211_01420 [Bacteroidales bacterium]|nr:hypothetical protein [Bacteroidales bacterium]
MTKLETPVGILKIYLNGQEFDFEPIKSDLGYYYKYNDIVFPDLLYNIKLDLNQFKKGDIIVAQILGAKLEYESGDERTITKIGTNSEYTFGLGSSDDFDYYDFGFNPDSPNFDFNKDIKVPFHLSKVLENGYEIKIIDNPNKYPNIPFQFIIGCVKGTSDLEYDLIYYCTC